MSVSYCCPHLTENLTGGLRRRKDLLQLMVLAVSVHHGAQLRSHHGGQKAKGELYMPRPASAFLY